MSAEIIIIVEHNSKLLQE